MAAGGAEVVRAAGLVAGPAAAFFVVVRPAGRVVVVLRAAGPVDAVLRTLDAVAFWAAAVLEAVVPVAASAETAFRVEA